MPGYYHIVCGVSRPVDGEWWIERSAAIPIDEWMGEVDAVIKREYFVFDAAVSYRCQLLTLNEREQLLWVSAPMVRG